MELNAEKQLIRTILSNKNKYNIPRYQREYSWEKDEISEYMEDIIKQLKLVDGVTKSDDYFIGSILLTGDYHSSGKILDVVDGQQRLTTITILLSALGDAFLNIHENDLYNIVWEYIVGKDDNAEEYPILFNEVQYPYFQYYIQRKQREQVEPTCEEEDRISYAFQYFATCLQEDNLKKMIQKNNPAVDLSIYSYKDLLKGVRDQILNSYVICIWTTEVKYANEIFEILNAKGKQLAAVDLIKNNIFKVLNKEIPDDPQLKWKAMKKNLNYKNGRVDFSTFYRQFWISKYKKVTQEKLYDDFINTIEEDKDSYRMFVNELYQESLTYMKIVDPKREDYNNRKEYFYLVESLKNVNDVFGIKQTRIAYLALFNVKEKNIITHKQFKRVINLIENFHFVYNAVCALRANAFESIYSQFAISLNHATNGNEAEKIINKLTQRMKDIYPSYEVFEDRFIKIKYSKNYLNTNMLAKYVVNRIENYYGKTELNRDDGSIEHILSETKDKEYSLNVGNLILLEININRDCENFDFADKKRIYTNSKYDGVRDFLIKCDSISAWGQDEIINRAKELAKLVYYDIIDFPSNIF